MNFPFSRKVALTLTLALAFLATSIASSAQTYKVVATLTGNNAYPKASLIQGVNGELYGTSYGAPGSSYGSVFEVDTSGTVTTLYTFCSKSNCSDGSYPAAGLLLAKDLNFYGTTTSGGKYGEGTIFKLTPKGKLTTLYSFCEETNCPDGEDPVGGLIQATNGLLYGTTAYGGANAEGTVFSISTAGTFTSLYSFCNEYKSCQDGLAPESDLVQGSNGNFYGTTAWGTIFEVTPQGALTVLYEFCSLPSCQDGNDPVGNLAQSLTGFLYGGTTKGGIGGGVEWEFDTADNGFADVFDWGGDDGALPNSVTLGSDGNVYGTTQGSTGASGAYYPSTAYEISTKNNGFSLLYTFCPTSACTAGGPAIVGMLQRTDGIFYGVLSDGKVYSLSTGLAPFVTTTPTTGAVGSAVYILGTDLTGTTAVTFNGISAKFTVESSSEIKASVPRKATTGSVEVTTPNGKLTSNTPFTVP